MQRGRVVPEREVIGNLAMDVIRAWLAGLLHSSGLGSDGWRQEAAPIPVDHPGIP
jgi:hypothetical protein